MFRSCLGVLCLLVAGLVAAAQDQDQAELHKLIDKAIKAHGGGRCLNQIQGPPGQVQGEVLRHGRGHPLLG